MLIRLVLNLNYLHDLNSVDLEQALVLISQLKR